MTTIVILDFASSIDSDGRPIGNVASVWDRVLMSISKIPGWKSTKCGPQSDDKHGVIILIVWRFKSPPDGFPFLFKEPSSLSSPLRPLTALLASKPRVLNVPLFPAPELPQDYLLSTGTFELELLHLPQDTRLHTDRTFDTLFRRMTVFLESQIDRCDTPPFDFHSGHRGWLWDEETKEGTIDSTPVHIIILHYSSLEGERRFKDPNVAHKGMLRYQDGSESLYQRYYLEVLADLEPYGVRRESVHFRLKRWTQDVASTATNYRHCCSMQ
ncbi:MAG: hypothetical protein Q9192_004358 [Flavoplaca navasiana]